MGDKVGSSSYSTGDAGGSAGDYHGVSESWVHRRTSAGVKKASAKRLASFGEHVRKRMIGTDKTPRKDKQYGSMASKYATAFNAADKERTARSLAKMPAKERKTVMGVRKVNQRRRRRK